LWSRLAPFSPWSGQALQTHLPPLTLRSGRARRSCRALQAGLAPGANRALGPRKALQTHVAPLALRPDHTLRTRLAPLSPESGSARRSCWTRWTLSAGHPLLSLRPGGSHRACRTRCARQSGQLALQRSKAGFEDIEAIGGRGLSRRHHLLRSARLRPGRGRLPLGGLLRRFLCHSNLLRSHRKRIVGPSRRFARPDPADSPVGSETR
jgi:hypothetical protein